MGKRNWSLWSAVGTMAFLIFSRPYLLSKKVIPMDATAKRVLARGLPKNSKSSLFERLPLPFKKMNKAMKTLQDFDLKSDEKAGVVKNI